MIEKILQDPVYQSGSFGDVKDFLLEMMEMYHYEETLLRSTITLVRCPSSQSRSLAATRRCSHR